MKRIHIFLVSFLFLLTQTAQSQNAPITSVGCVYDASAGPITVPVTVSNFENIGSITLTLNYDPAVITFTGSVGNPAFDNLHINSSTPGEILIGWTTTTSAVNLLDGSTLADLNFDYVSGGTQLTWDNSSNNGGSCEYTDGSFSILNDDPSSDYYIGGYITNHAAPITYAPTITNASGSVIVPITIENFVDIGAVALTIEYNASVISYVSSSNPAFAGLQAGNEVVGNNGTITIGYTGSAKSLTNGDVLIELNFTYISGTTTLAWKTDGFSCEYGDASANRLWDFPFEDFYIDGLVTGQTAPITYAPTITNASGSVIVPITIENFVDIGAVALTLEYDASVISYVNSSNPAFAGLQAGNEVVGNNGTITIGYTGSAKSLTNGDVLIELNFTYISGTTTLAWKTDGFSCEYGDASAIRLWDRPFEDYYFNGLVAEHVAPRIKADSMSATSVTQISIPVRVWDFNDISSMSLTIDYDPGVLTYVGASPHPDIANKFTEGSSPGRISMGWFNDSDPYSSFSLPDETVLFFLNFTYNGGISPLIWHDNGGSCEFAAGPSITVLYDEPTEDHYINGLVDENAPAPPIPHIWTGSVSTEWNDPDNWYGFIVPISSNDVHILLTLPAPLPSPPHWPVYTGDFTLGVQCKSIDLGDETEMSVTGNMIINPGHKFNNAGTAVLRVGGDWLNSGIFVPATGEVNFINIAVEGNIPAVLPVNEVQNYLLSTSSASLIPISGGTAGPSGDNEHSDVGIGFTFNYAGTDYTQVRINTNGWLSLNLSGIDLTSMANVWLFAPVDPVTVLAPWWDDLEADGSSSISYLTSGTSPNQVFTVEWNDVLAYSSGATARLNFQVKLYETTNVVEFCYGTVAAGTHAVIEAASIGIKGPTGGDGDFIESTTGTTNTKIIYLKSEWDWPTVNYKFIPPQDTITFYKLSVSDNVILNVQTNIKVLGVTP